MSQLLTKVSGLLLEPRKPNFEAAAKTADILLNHLMGTSTCARGGRKSVGGFPQPAREIREIREGRESNYVSGLELPSITGILPFPGRMGELNNF